jgi:hypothetical protein
LFFVLYDKKRARSSINPTASSKRLRISLTSPPPTTPSQAWERQQLESQSQESLAAPTEGSHAGTGSVATTEAAEDGYIDNGGDDFDGLDWDRLGRRWIKPLKQPARSQSWIYAHGYRVVRMDEPTRLFWVYKYCHIHKATAVSSIALKPPPRPPPILRNLSRAITFAVPASQNRKNFHFATSSGEIHDLPIALPQLNGAHTGEAIAAAVVAKLRVYRITSDTLGYFVLDNASNNDLRGTLLTGTLLRVK